MHNLCVVCVCRELTQGPEYILPFSCQSASLCLGDKLCQLSVWLFGARFDWRLALELQKSALRFPRDTTCLAQGTFVRSIFISLLFSQAISPGHSVRRHLSLTVKLSLVCASVWCASVCLSGTRCMSHECPKDNPWSRWWQNELRRWMFSQHRRISSQLAWLICWIAVSGC